MGLSRLTATAMMVAAVHLTSAPVRRAAKRVIRRVFPIVSRQVIAPCGVELTPEDQATRLTYSDIPNIKSIDGAIERIRELFGVDVTEHFLRRAIRQRRLPRHEIGHVLHFSERNLYDFIVLGTRKASA